MEQVIYDQTADNKLTEIDVFGVKINPLTKEDFLYIIQNGIKSGKRISQFGVNSDTINTIVRNEEYKQLINKADLIHIDGMSVLWALRLFGYSVPERVATPDLADDVLALADREKMKVFLFGAKEEVLILCRQNIEKRYPNLDIVGSRNGYYSPGEVNSIYNQINLAAPDILFLGMSSPQKELFYTSCGNNLKALYILGVGGFFDILSGIIKRAPLWMQKTGFEWLFRLIQEPKRLWKRYLIGIFQFLWLTTKEKFRRTFKKNK